MGIRAAEGERGGIECCGCRAQIIVCCDDCAPWQITVRTPAGASHVGGDFCSSCIVRFAKLGLFLSPTKQSYTAPRLRPITDPAEIAAITDRMKRGSHG